MTELFENLPETRYRTVVLDPPWKYGDSLPGPARGAEKFYRTMTREQLVTLPVDTIALPDAHLYVWVTNAHIEWAYFCARAWGFDPKTMLTWVKTRKDVKRIKDEGDLAFGMGWYYRGATEHALFCVRGDAPPLDRSTRNVVLAPRGEHSEKPGRFYDIVRKVSPGPRLDMFARQRREGFDAWGDEAP